MRRRLVLWSGLSVAILLAIGAGWMVSLPSAPAAARTQPVPQAEVDATLAALKPPKRTRPVIAIIGINDGTETTDYLMPYGILRRADIADVTALATSPGPVTLYPALKVEPDGTIADFDARHPEGADYVIVPAMHRDDDPVALQWIREQAAKGAVIVGICAGAKVVGAAGLLDGRQATTHWYYRDQLQERHPSIRFTPDRRFVVDRGVATTTGISASMPMSLTLIEAIAGRGKAEQIARELGVASWDARHDSGIFIFTRPFALTAIGNTLAFWNRETLSISLAPGVDEVSLALVADAWSRTYRSRVVTVADEGRALQSRSGLGILPDLVATSRPTEGTLDSAVARRPVPALNETLQAIADRYRSDTADLVAMQLEYSKQAASGERRE
jgi:putative intracellular protease/amidase